MKPGLWTRGVVARLAAMVTACTTTQQVAIKQSDLRCAFLGSDCAKLARGAPGRAALRYVNPDADWTQ